MASCDGREDRDHRTSQVNKTAAALPTASPSRYRSESSNCAIDRWTLHGVPQVAGDATPSQNHDGRDPRENDERETHPPSRCRSPGAIFASRTAGREW